VRAAARPTSWAFVVLNWNGREDTLRCLAALRAVHGEHRVYVADNGSADGSLAAIGAAHPEAVLIENGANLGYAGGNNPAIERAVADGAEWVVLLNNDAWPDPDVLRALGEAAAQRPDAGVLAGMLLFEDGRVQWAGQRLGLRSGYSGRPRGYGRPLAEVDVHRGDPQPVARGVGALMAVSRAAIERVGVFDDDLFAYVEDVDWCLRIRAAGFGCFFVPEARAVHALSASTGGDAGSTATLYYGARNTIVVCERHRPLGTAGTLLRRATIAATFLLRAATVQRSRAAFAAVAEGVRDGVRRRLGPR
jgi:GT2 family glycosyltransferase